MKGTLGFSEREAPYATLDAGIVARHSRTTSTA
jgi:hypothetical protein